MLKLLLKLIPKNKYPSFIWLIVLFTIGGFLETIGIGIFIPLLKSFSEDLNLSVPILEEFLEKIPEELYLVNFEITIFIIFVSIFILKNLIVLHTLRFQNKFIQDTFLILSTTLLDKYFNQNYMFHIKNNSSKLIRNMSTDLTLYQSTLMNFLEFISKFIIVIGIFFLLIIVNTSATIFSIILFVTIFLLFNFFTKTLIVKWGKTRHFFSGEWLKNLQQSLSSMNILKVFNAQSYFLSQYRGSLKNLTEAAKKHDNLQGYPRVFFEILIISSLTLFCFYFFKIGYSFEKILLTISFYFFSILRVGPPIILIIKSFISFDYGRKTIIQLNKEFSLKSSDKKTKTQKIIFNKSLELKNIDFAYDENNFKTLSKVNLNIKKNEFVGILGASGSGKTTLINIIMGLLTPVSGKFLVDKKIIDNQSKSWIDKIGYVPQSTFLLDASIKENIAFGKFHHEINKANIEKVIKKTQLNHFIKKIPKKLKVNVGERGSKISEGQKQRIGIARALYKNPDILIFDEITSALDENTEKKIMKHINSFKNKKTIFLITHKKNILNKCHKIIEIKNGKVKIFKNS